MNGDGSAGRILEIFQEIISDYHLRLLPSEERDYVRLRGNEFYLEIYAHLDEVGVMYYWVENEGRKKKCNITRFTLVRGNITIKKEYYLTAQSYTSQQYFLGKIAEGLARQPDILNGDREWLNQYRVFWDCEIAEDTETEGWE